MWKQMRKIYVEGYPLCGLNHLTNFDSYDVTFYYFLAHFGGISALTEC